MGQQGNIIRAKLPRPPNETRRIRKPLMERKRRERINTSLNDLATLLAEAHLVKSEAGKPTKLEKADILELTVKHLLRLKSRASGTSKGAAAPPSCLLGGEDSQKGGSSVCVLFQGGTVPQGVTILEGKKCPTGSIVSQDDAIPPGSIAAQEDTITQGNIVEEENSVPQSGSSTHERTDLQGGTTLQQGGTILQRYTVPQGGIVPSHGTTTVKTFQASEDERPTLKTSQCKTPTSRGTENDENYRLGFKKCMSTIDSAMKQYLEHEHDNIRPRLQQHLHSFLKLMDNKSSSVPQVFLQGQAQGASTSALVSTTPEEQPLSHPIVPISKAMNSDQFGVSSSSQVTGLTLVPTRLPSGSLAFVIQGALDPSMLFQTAEDGIRKDSQILPKVSIRNVKAETSPSKTAATLTVSSGVQALKVPSTATKIEPGRVKSERSKFEIKNDTSKQTSTLEELTHADVYAEPITSLETISSTPCATGATNSAPGVSPFVPGATPSAPGASPSATPSAPGASPSASPSAPETASSIPSTPSPAAPVRVMVFSKSSDKLSGFQNLHRLPPTPPTPPTGGILSRISPTLSTPTTSKGLGTLRFTHHRVSPSNSRSQYEPPTPSPTREELRQTPATTPSSQTIIKCFQSTSITVQPKTSTQYLPATPSGTAVRSVQILTPDNTPPGNTFHKLPQQSCFLTPTPTRNVYMLPPTPPTPPTLRVLQLETPTLRVLQKESPTLQVLEQKATTLRFLHQEAPLQQPPAMSVFIRPQIGGDQVLEEAEAMEVGGEVEMGVGEDVAERRQPNNMPFDLSLRRMWRPW